MPRFTLYTWNPKTRKFERGVSWNGDAEWLLSRLVEIAEITKKAGGRIIQSRCDTINGVSTLHVISPASGNHLIGVVNLHARQIHL